MPERSKAGSSRRRPAGHEFDNECMLPAKRKKASDASQCPEADNDARASTGNVSVVQDSQSQSGIETILGFMRDIANRMSKIENENNVMEAASDGLQRAQVTADVHMSQDGVKGPKKADKNSNYVIGVECISSDENDNDYYDNSVPADDEASLPDFVGFGQGSQAGLPLASSGFDKVAADMAEFFQHDDNAGEALPDSLAAMLNGNLRKRPIDGKIKDLAARIQFPSNVPNFKVPAMNKDILHSMNQNTKMMELRLANTNNLLGKAMVPIVRVLKDAGLQQAKPVSEYISDLQDSLRLLLAAFNYQNHARKELVKCNVKDTPLQSLCSWDYDVGTNEIFSFNVSKRCGDIARSRKIGQPYRPFRGRPFGGRGRGGRGQHQQRGGFKSQSFLWKNSQRGKNQQNKF